MEATKCPPTLPFIFSRNRRDDSCENTEITGMEGGICTQIRHLEYTSILRGSRHRIYFSNSPPCKVLSLPISSGKYGCRAQIFSTQGHNRFKSSLHQGPKADAEASAFLFQTGNQRSCSSKECGNVDNVDNVGDVGNVGNVGNVGDVGDVGDVDKNYRN